MRTLHSVVIAVAAAFLFTALALAKPPSWDDQINNAGRFKVLNEFGGAAVLDKESGLVWEKSPSTSIFTWLNAHGFCNNQITGGRRGWRLPTIQELASLMDPNNTTDNPNLPPGHPFSDVQSSSRYWSATADAGDASRAWNMWTPTGVVDPGVKTSTFFVWCVRGGQGVDLQ